MPDSSDDRSPDLEQVSGSSIDEDNDPDEVEDDDADLHEQHHDDEEEEEAEAEEEEEEEERFEVDMDISNSPVHVVRRRHHPHHRDVEPGGSTQGTSEARLPSYGGNVGDSRANFNYGTQEFAMNDARILSGGNTSTHYTESYASAGAHFRSNEMRDVKATNSASVAGKEVRRVINSEDETRQAIQSMNDRKQMESRLSRSVASEIGTQMISPVAETNDPNKPPAILCDFFAKGWCIRGSSCRFIHTKDSPKNSHSTPEGNVAVASCSREVKVDEGPTEVHERSRLPGFRDPLASSSGNNFPFPAHIGRRSHHQFQSVHHDESNVGDSADVLKLNLPKDDLIFLSSSFKDTGKDGQKRIWPADDYNNSPIKKGRYSVGNPSSHSSSMEDLAEVRRQRVYSDHTSPLVSHSLNSSSHTLTATGLFPNSRISNWTGFSLPASYSSLDPNTLSSHKLFDSKRDYHSTRSSSFLKNFPPTSISLHGADVKTKSSSNNWEPSVPFRPSFILPPAFLSFSAKQFDRFQGSIELPKLANNSFETSLYPEGTTVGKRLYQKTHAESGSGNLRAACDGDTNSMSSHNEKVLDNSCYTREPNSPVNEAETVGTSVVYQNGTLAKDENPMGHLQVKGSTDPTKIFGDPKHQSEGSSHQRDIKVDRLKRSNEAVVEQTDEDVQQESKEMRQFRVALIELVKELLKPKWREGSLSKDAHNKIVKKAVDKILSAFQPEQIPPTIESVVQYLTACRPKISKLVEGYLEKYGKPELLG